MTLDPQVAKLLRQMAGPAITDITVDQARREMIRSSQQLGEPPELPLVEDRTVPGPNGDIPIRVYKPIDTDATLPVLVYFHGGGWVIGSIDTHDKYCRQLALAAEICIISVDYRLAPEHPYPAPADDCYAATKWIAENANELRIDAGRLAVGGDSAGGNLAAVVTLMSRDRGGPSLAFQLLIYPITDCDFDTESYLKNATGYHLTRAAMMWFWVQYVPNASQRRQQYAAPLRAENLDRLPPAFVLTAEYDPLCDEGEKYARRLEQAGNRVELRRYDGTIHGFVRRSHLLDCAQVAMTDVARSLKKNLGT